MNTLFKTLFATVLISLLLSTAAFAQTTRLLVPVYAQGLPGAAGSVWSTEFRVLNTGTTLATLAPPCSGAVCINVEIPPGHEVDPIMYLDSNITVAPQPFFFSAPSAVIDNLAFQLRVLDESRVALNWGTSVPVIDYDHEKGTEFWFVRVPAAAPFRHTVRIYTDNPGVTARVRYHDADTGTLLAERELPLNDNFLELHSLNVPELQTAGNVRIEITANAHVWSMVSITNNDTQVVTILPGQQVEK